MKRECFRTSMYSRTQAFPIFLVCTEKHEADWIRWVIYNKVEVSISTRLGPEAEGCVNYVETDTEQHIVGNVIVRLNAK